MNKENLKYFLKRKAIRIGGNVLRRTGLLIEGMPNGMGEDKKYFDKKIDGEILVHFSDTPPAVYQIKDWLKVFEKLRQKVVILTADSRTASSIKKLTNLKVITLRRYVTVDSILQKSNFKICFYVNFTSRNYLMLRFTNLIHAHLTHGDSDKNVTTSGQIKAFDFAFVPGQANIDRAKKYIPFYDADKHLVKVGQPFMPKFSNKKTGKILYAPTWEGGTISANYGSVPIFGEKIVKKLGSKLIYRPHPSSGVRLESYGNVTNKLKEVVIKSGGKVSTNSLIYDDFNDADVLITDISSVAIDWLATQKPLIVTSIDNGSEIMKTKLLDYIVRLDDKNINNIENAIKDSKKKDMRTMSEYYLGTNKDSFKEFQKQVDKLVKIAPK